MGGMLQDKVIIVTGGGSGIGATSARLFAEEGAWVVVADRDAAQGAAVVDQIGALGHKARFIAADVSHEGQVESMIGTVLSENGRIDGAFRDSSGWLVGDVFGCFGCDDARGFFDGDRRLSGDV